MYLNYRSSYISFEGFFLFFVVIKNYYMFRLNGFFWYCKINIILIKSKYVLWVMSLV